MFASEIIVEPCWTPMKSWSNLISTTISRQRVCICWWNPINPPWNPIKKHIKSDEPITHHEINHYIPCPISHPPFFTSFYSPIHQWLLTNPRASRLEVWSLQTHGSQGAVESDATVDEWYSNGICGEMIIDTLWLWLTVCHGKIHHF